jgi:hypothetical protein
VGIFRRGSKDTSATPEIANVDGDDPVATDADESGLDGGRSGTEGPFDRAEVDGLEGRLDLGALWMTGIPGMELRLEVEEESQSVVGVTAVLGESAVQLQAFAAPRSEGIWEDIRTEIAASITSQGGTADVTSGPFGTELLARMPGQGPDGRTVFSPARFVGVDGPRWFLRAVLSGRAAIDQDAAAALLDVVRSTVVVRGHEAMAPRELLALKLPDQVEAPGENGADGSDGADGAYGAGQGQGEHAMAAPRLSDLNPFARGPEITEIH